MASGVQVSRVDTCTGAKPLQASDSEWEINSPPLQMGIPDGDDLLFTVAADFVKTDPARIVQSGKALTHRLQAAPGSDRSVLKT